LRYPSKRLGIFVAVAVATVLVAACSKSPTDNGGTQSSPGFAECVAKPNDCNSGPRANGGTMTFVLEQDMAAWHPNAASGTHFGSAQVLNSVYPTPFNVLPNYDIVLNTDLMASAEETSKDPQTIVWKIRPEAVWSDGTPVTAKDFLFNLWTFDGKTCTADQGCTPAATSGFDQIQQATASDNDKTVTTVFAQPYPDWKSLFQLLPAHIAQSQGGWNGTKEDAAGLGKAFKWFIANQPTVSGGPYLIDKFEKGVAVTQVRNPRWYGTAKPTLDKLVWRLIEEQSALVPAARNREVNALYPQPNADLVAQVKGLDAFHYFLAPGMSWEHVDLNTKNPALADRALRQAIQTAINRTDIISKTVGVMDPTIKPLGHHVFVPGIKGYQDVVTPLGLGAGDIEKAKGILTAAGYRIDNGKLIGKDGQPVPTLRFRHTVGNKLRADTAALIQQHLKQIGVDIRIETTDELSTTLDNGDYDLILFAWVTSPFVGTTLKDLWGTGSGQNYNEYSNEQFDAIANEAARTADQTRFIDLVNRGDAILAEDAVTLPLFQRLNLIVVDKKYVNVRNNGTNLGPAYNAQLWGLRAD
jgi:peptide/nickel transport system substrate-binding protein